MDAFVRIFDNGDELIYIESDEDEGNKDTGGDTNCLNLSILLLVWWLG